MEELLEFLQVDLEKDFGYHDDEAINALAQSIAELRKAKMHLPRDPPSDSEKPTRPFGVLLQSDNVSLYTVTDNQSTLGSIVLRQDGTTGMETAHTSSEEDVADPAEEHAEQQMKNSKEASNAKQVMALTAKEICDEIKFIDSATNALNTPDVELDNFAILDHREQEAASLNGISEIVKMVEEMEREQFGTASSSSPSGRGEERFGTDEVILSSATSVLVALRGTTTSDSEDFMQDWPDSRNPYTLSTDQKDSQYSSQTSSPSKETFKSTVASAKQANGGDRSIARRTSIPKLVSTRNSSDVTTSTYTSTTFTQNKVPSFIPRVVRSPTSGDSRDQRDGHRPQQVTISVGKESGLRSTGRRGSATDPEKVRIFVPYDDMSRVVGNKGSNALPAVDT